MSTYMYVDYSNFYVTGRHYSAVVRGMACSIQEANLLPHVPDWICDFNNLYTTSKRALLVTSGKFDYKYEAQKAGFEVKVLPRHRRSGEKQVDTTIAVEMIADAYNYINPDLDNVILVAGDLDHLPAVSHLVSAGVDVTVMFWSSCSAELAYAATRFVDLSWHYENLTIPYKKQYRNGKVHVQRLAK